MRGLMNSSAPISGFVRPSPASRAICASCAVSASRVSTRGAAHRLAGGEQLAPGALGERLAPRCGRTCRARRAAARVRRRAGARGAATRRRRGARGRGGPRRGCARAARWPRGRALRRLAVGQQRARAGLHAERPVGAAAPVRARSGARARSAVASVAPLRAPASISSTSAQPKTTTSSCSQARLGARQRLLVAAEAVVQQRGRPLDGAPAPCRRRCAPPRAGRPRSARTPAASSPRHAASISDPYCSGAMPVACAIASASSISAAAAANCPAQMCSAARYVAAIGSTLSAPASRATPSARVASSCHELVVPQVLREATRQPEPAHVVRQLARTPRRRVAQRRHTGRVARR